MKISRYLEKITYMQVPLTNKNCTPDFCSGILQYRSKVSRQSLASQSPRLETRFSKLSRMESRVSRIGGGPQKSDFVRFENWLSGIENVNCKNKIFFGNV